MLHVQADKELNMKLVERVKKSDYAFKKEKAKGQGVAKELEEARKALAALQEVCRRTSWPSWIPAAMVRWLESAAVVPPRPWPDPCRCPGGHEQKETR